MTRRPTWLGYGLTVAALFAFLAFALWSERYALRHVMDLIRGTADTAVASDPRADPRPLGRHLLRTWLPLAVLTLALAGEGLRRLLSKT
jgi:hypothetical protein